MFDFYMSDVQSPVCERVAIMLEECELVYESHVIPIGKNAKKPPEFLALNPRGTIPALVDRSDRTNPIAIVQAGAILLHLAEKTGRFLPANAVRRATTYQWLMCALTDAQPVSMAAFLCERAVPGGPSSATHFFEASFVTICRAFDQALVQDPYLGGADPSLADIALYPTAFYRRPLLGKAGNLDNLMRWMATMAARPAVQRVFHDWKEREARLAGVSL
ncbi:MAG: glutathione S-transferase family protein [Dongiaceae bacterium]